MNHCYLYPTGFKASASNVVPLPSSGHYKRFLELQTKASRLLSKTFPEIGYWEIGNESNTDRFLAKPGYPEKDAPPEGKAGPELSYTDDEKAAITADICLYSTKGVREGNALAKTVLPSPAGNAERTAEFIGKLYRLTGGKFRDYFDIVSCHPYNFDGQSDRLKAYCDTVRAVSEEYGDLEAGMFVTEYGYYDDDLVKFGLTPAESDTRQAAYLLGDLKPSPKNFLTSRRFIFSVCLIGTAGRGWKKHSGFFQARIPLRA
jgi:hypothetical protein